MSSHITDFLYFVAGLFFISLTSFTIVSSTQLGNDALLDSTDTEYRSLSEHFAPPVSTTSDKSQRKSPQRKQAAESKMKKLEISEPYVPRAKTFIAKGARDDCLKNVQHNLTIADYHTGSGDHGLHTLYRT